MDEEKQEVEGAEWWVACSFPPNLNILPNGNLVNLKTILPEVSRESKVVVAQRHNERSPFYCQK